MDPLIRKVEFGQREGIYSRVNVYSVQKRQYLANNDITNLGSLEMNLKLPKDR